MAINTIYRVNLKTNLSPSLGPVFMLDSDVLHREEPRDEFHVTPVAPVATSTKLADTAVYICVVCRRI